MKKLVRGALLALVVAAAAAPAPALPPDCSTSYCLENPDGVCAWPYRFQVVYCEEWCTTYWPHLC